MAYIDFVTPLHTSTKRDYLARVNGRPKAECARIAKQWGQQYWDGGRDTGYGGYTYDGRWQSVARAMVARYELVPGDSVLDLGCGKAHLLYELMTLVPGLDVRGIDISEYAIANCKPEVRPFLEVGDAQLDLDLKGRRFDLVLAINLLHNLRPYDMYACLQNIEQAARERSYICVESWDTEERKANLLYWQLTCETFLDTETWERAFSAVHYTGDHSFIFFD